MISIKIISWNIWGGKNLPEIIDVIKKEGVDIIALQEVLQDEDGSNNNAKSIAKMLGYEYYYEPTTLLTPSVSHLLKEHGFINNMWWGNAILSRYPIIKRNIHVLSDTHKRVALEAVVNVQGKNLHVFSTHLMYTNFEPSEVQITQVQNLLKIIPEKYSILMGDFNATPESEPIQKIKKASLSTSPTESTE